MSTNSIGSFLAALRKASGMTQKQLAEKLNVSDKAVSRWERDECAPDLTLIPVLAEIFDVTCDDILRGQRANPDTAQTPQTEARVQKQLRHLLTQAKTNYRIRSLISCMIAAAALITAMVCNLGFNRAYLGFLCGALLFLAAAVCQTIFSIQVRAALENEDFDSASVEETKHSILLLTERVYTLIVVLFAGTLPLMIVENAYWGLSAKSWLMLGLICVAMALILCAIVCRKISIRKGVRKHINWKAPINKLRIRMSCILTSAILVTGILQLIAAAYLSDHCYLYSNYTQFHDWDSFKAYMEQPISYDGEVLTYQTTDYDENKRIISVYTDSEGNEYWYYIQEEGCRETVTAKDGTVLCKYNRLNENVCRVTYSSTNGLLPIYVQNQEQAAEASHSFNLLMAAWIPLYIIEAAAAIAIYHKKLKNVRPS